MRHMFFGFVTLVSLLLSGCQSAEDRGGPAAGTLIEDLERRQAMEGVGEAGSFSEATEVWLRYDNAGASKQFAAQYAHSFPGSVRKYRELAATEVEIRIRQLAQVNDVVGQSLRIDRLADSVDFALVQLGADHPRYESLYARYDAVRRQINRQKATRLVYAVYSEDGNSSAPARPANFVACLLAIRQQTGMNWDELGLSEKEAAILVDRYGQEESCRPEWGPI